MTNEQSLRASVEELISTFRQGLVSLVPAADRSLLNWRDDEHPDWERIAQSLFQAFVGGPVFVDDSRSESEYPLARYDIDQDNYREVSWVSPSMIEPSLAFVRFVSAASPFDTAEFAELDLESLEVTKRDIERPASSAYALVRHDRQGEIRLQSKIVAND